MADNTETASGTGVKVATDKVTYSGDADQNVQLVKLVAVTGAEGSKTVLDVAQAEDAAHNTGDIGVMLLGVRNSTHAVRTSNDGDYGAINIDAEGCVVIVGNVAHDAVDADPPIKIGDRAINHGTNPTSVATADRTDWLSNRAGVPFVMGGHPNVQTVRLNFTAAQTNTSVIAGAANVRIVVTSFMFTLDNASTVFPTAVLGFAASTTPTTTQVIGAHGGIPAGGGFGRGDGSGILGIGAAADPLLLTTTGIATGNGVNLVVTYYTISEA